MEWEEDVICGFVSFEPVLTAQYLPCAGFYSSCLYNDKLRGYELPRGRQWQPRVRCRLFPAPPDFLGEWINSLWDNSSRYLLIFK